MENFNGAMLSSWNSVSGPKIEHLWLTNDHALFCLPKEHCINIKYFETIKDRYSFINFKRTETLRLESNSENLIFPLLIEKVRNSFRNFREYLRMSGKLLLTELETKRPFKENCCRIYQLEDKILFSIVFFNQTTNVNESDNTSLCLSVMFSGNKTAFIFKVQNVLDSYLRYIVSVLQKSSDFSMLHKLLLSEDVSKHFLNLCQAIEAIHQENEQIKEIQYFPRFSQFQLRVKFLSRAIVSHMQTSGYSVVTGTSKFTVNQVALLLLLFNTNKEKFCSVPVFKNSQGVCYRSLQVQGLLRDYTEFYRFELPEEYYNDLPITILDTDSYKVRQSMGNISDQNFSKSLKTVTDSGKLIPKFLQDIFLLEECKLSTKKLLYSLCRCIHIKAVTLIKVIERFRNEGCVATEKQLMLLMNVEDVTDFKIYLGFAEKLKPGIRTFTA